MSDFLNSLKADLLEARTRAVLGLLIAALVAAVAYAVLGGGSSSPPPRASSPGAGSGSAGIAAVPAPLNSHAALAEITSGASVQRGGASRDPFTPLPGSVSTVSSPASGSSSGKSKSTGSQGSSTGKSEAGKSTHEATANAPETSKPSPPAKPKTVYHVDVRFGTIAPGTPPQNARLTAFDNLKSHQPLPSTRVPLVAFDGVTAGGRRAKFKLVGEAFLRGVAACLPSISLCQAITLARGQSEELDFLAPGAPRVVYELRVVRITSKRASTASRRRARHARAAIATASRTGPSAGYGSAFATSSAR